MPKPKVDYYYAFTRLRGSRGNWMVPPELRELLVQEARRHNTSMNEMATKVLADAFGFPYEIRERGSSIAVRDAEHLNLRLPARLVRKMRVKNPDTVPDVVRRTLTEHFGLVMPPKVRQTRQARVS